MFGLIGFLLFAVVLTVIVSIQVRNSWRRIRKPGVIVAGAIIVIGGWGFSSGFAWTKRAAAS